jgi:hypothetical protein
MAALSILLDQDDIRNCLRAPDIPFRSTSVHPDLSGVRVALSLVFNVVFCRSLFVILSLFFWPFYCLFFDLWLLITF